jgi:hypothetical protein
MERHGAQCRHLSLALSPPHEGYDGNVAHALEDSARGRARTGSWAIRQGFPAFCQASARLSLDQGVHQQRAQVHAAQGGNACGGFQEDRGDRGRVLGLREAQLRGWRPVIRPQQLGIREVLGVEHIARQHKPALARCPPGDGRGGLLPLPCDAPDLALGAWGVLRWTPTGSPLGGDPLGGHRVGPLMIVQAELAHTQAGRLRGIRLAGKGALLPLRLEAGQHRLLCLLSGR